VPGDADEQGVERVGSKAYSSAPSNRSRTVAINIRVTPQGLHNSRHHRVLGRVIQREEGCLPRPYLPGTRTAPKGYRHEMTAGAHAELLALLKKCQGKVMLSGHRCPLSDRDLARWVRHDFQMPNNSAGGKSKRRRIESLWCNF
jgi:hypothetical protein